MTLFTRYNRIMMLITALIFILSSLVYYFLLNYVLIQQIDEVLSHRKIRMENFVHAKGSLPLEQLGEVQVSYTPVTKPVTEYRSFVTLYDSLENKTAPFRK